MQPKLEFITDLAHGAGAILREHYGRRDEVSHKGVIDLVTKADHRAEDYLLGRIAETFPEHRIFSEETGGRAGSDDHVWYVDPLDGTVNYAHGLAIFCTSIAYSEDGDLKLAAVYDPMADELYLAQRGQGATLNGERMQVAPAQELVDALLVTGFPYDAWTNPDNNMREFEAFSKVSQGVRRLGSAALDLCYVAAGRLDGFWEKKLNAWDVAAGGLLVQEAGGLATNLRGGDDFLGQPQSILAANPAIHAKMLAILNE
jgi:myo-inositol-1(or 4)-monophosphatase